MTGASLEYSVNYSNKALNVVGIDGHWQSSAISNTSYSRNLRITTDGIISPYNHGNKHIGRAVRCVFPNPGPIYSLPMGMGIMRVGVGELGVIRCRM